MAQLDRNSILRNDFPVVAEGFDPAAVRAHLERLADALGDGPVAKVATAVSSQIETIVAAAEKAAANIEREARERATKLSEGAADRARADVERFTQASAGLQEQLAGIESEVAALLGDLRGRVEAIGRAIGEVEARIQTSDAAPAAAPAPPTPAAPEGNGDREGARIAALDMALEGKMRGEIEGYLDTHFPAVGDRAALLDEVLAAADS